MKEINWEGAVDAFLKSSKVSWNEKKTSTIKITADE